MEQLCKINLDLNISMLFVISLGFVFFVYVSRFLFVPHPRPEEQNDIRCSFPRKVVLFPPFICLSFFSFRMNGNPSSKKVMLLWVSILNYFFRFSDSCFDEIFCFLMKALPCVVESVKEGKPLPRIKTTEGSGSEEDPLAGPQTSRTVSYLPIFCRALEDVNIYCSQLAPDTKVRTAKNNSFHSLRRFILSF